MDLSSGAFGARWPARTVAVELSVPDSGATFLLLLSYVTQYLYCWIRVFVLETDTERFLFTDGTSFTDTDIADNAFIVTKNSVLRACTHM